MRCVRQRETRAKGTGGGIIQSRKQLERPRCLKSGRGKVNFQRGSLPEAEATWSWAGGGGGGGGGGRIVEVKMG